MGRLSCSNFLQLCIQASYHIFSVLSQNIPRFLLLSTIFLKILSQLNQTALPIFCDEGLFRIVFNIVLSNPKEFDKLIPMLGSFHTAKVVEHCIGKYLRGSGVEGALVEIGVFWFKSSRVYDEWVTLHHITSRYNYSRRCPQYLEMVNLLENKLQS